MKVIASRVARAGVEGSFGLQGGANSSGDAQKKLDVVANEVLTAALAASGKVSVRCRSKEGCSAQKGSMLQPCHSPPEIDTALGLPQVIASEEDESPVEVEGVAGGYAVVFDPLDGSRNIDVRPLAYLGIRVKG